jgi:NAD-dependent SIR2 family protein deacetylase
MATYHGLIKVTCLVCDSETTDDHTMEMLNDQDGSCPKCESQFFRWVNQDGSIVVSLTQDIDGLHTYDNLVMRGSKKMAEQEDKPSLCECGYGH